MHPYKKHKRNMGSIKCAWKLTSSSKETHAYTNSPPPSSISSQSLRFSLLLSSLKRFSLTSTSSTTSLGEIGATTEGEKWWCGT